MKKTKAIEELEKNESLNESSFASNDELMEPTVSTPNEKKNTSTSVSTHSGQPLNLRGRMKRNCKVDSVDQELINFLKFKQAKRLRQNKSFILSLVPSLESMPEQAS